MNRLRVVVLTRFPLAENTAWKRDLVDELQAAGHDVCVAFGQKGPAAHLREAVRRLKLHRGSRDLFGRSHSRVQERPAGRRELLTRHCRALKIPVRAFGSVNDAAARAWIEGLRPDLLILAGSEVIRKELLQVPRLGTINAHYGPLPRYRGMSALEWCLLLGDVPAVTVHLVDATLDTGDILLQKPLSLPPDADWSVLRELCQRAAKELLSEATNQLAAGRERGLRQEPSDGRQYFAIHPRLLNVAELRLRARQ